MRRYSPQNRIPRRRRPGVEPLDKLSHQPPHRILRFRRPIRPDIYRMTAVTARYIIRIRNALGQDAMEILDQFLRNRQGWIGRQQLPHVPHQGFGVAGFPFLPFPPRPQGIGPGRRGDDLADFLMGKFGAFDAGSAADRPQDVETVNTLLRRRRNGNLPNNPSQSMNPGQIRNDLRMISLEPQVEMNFPAGHNIP